MWDKVFKSGLSKFYGRQPLKKFTWSIVEYFVTCITTCEAGNWRGSDFISVVVTSHQYLKAITTNVFIFLDSLEDIFEHFS